MEGKEKITHLIIEQHADYALHPLPEPWAGLEKAVKELADRAAATIDTLKQTEKDCS